MKITKKQFAKIWHLMPEQRKKSTTSNYDFVCAMLYIIENGCKWRALPKEFGDWHTIYVRFNRWSKKVQLTAFLKNFKTKIQLTSELKS
ncbi:MAG: transposase [Oscillospiraceae bacterium]|nr:transposase [Oscillospiraceae bacterium]